MVEALDVRRFTSKERMERLRAALRADPRPSSQRLAVRMDRCAVDWQGRYECRSPACLHCRRRHIAREQRVALNWFEQHEKADLGFVSVVLAATKDVRDISGIIGRSREATRKRVAACRAKSDRWNGVYFAGWHEVDAVSPEQVPLLPPKRRPLLERLVTWSSDGLSPAWLGTFHGVIYLNGLPVEDVETEFRRQWKLPGQVDVRALKPRLTVPQNINNLVGYCNKFLCVTHLNDKYVEPWPTAWEVEFFSWLNDHQRNAFEALRITVGSKKSVPDSVSTGDNTSPMISMTGPMPCSFSRLSTYDITGGHPWT